MTGIFKAKWLIPIALVGTTGLTGLIFYGGSGSGNYDSGSLVQGQDSSAVQAQKVSARPSHTAALPQNATTEDKVTAQQQDLMEMRRVLGQIQAFQQSSYEDMNRRVTAAQAQAEQAEQVAKQSGISGGAPKVELSPMQRPSKLSERFSSEYQHKVSHFRGFQSGGWAMNDAAYTALTTPKPPLAPQPMLGGSQFEDVPISVSEFAYNIPAGTRIMAVTDQPVSSDHPGYFTSRIIRPEILRGATLICQNGGQQNNRIPVQPAKIVFKGREYSISGQIEMGFPGMEGHINRHYGSRALPIITNAAITGGFIAWSASNSNRDRIDTRDLITAEVVGQTLPQVQNEIAKFAVDRPNTVTVAQGAQFSVLLTNRLEVRY